MEVLWPLGIIAVLGIAYNEGGWLLMGTVSAIITVVFMSLSKPTRR